MLLCELLLRSQQLRLQRFAMLPLLLQLPGQVTDLARMLLAQLLRLSALLRQLPMQFTTGTLLLFKRLLQISSAVLVSTRCCSS